LFCNSWVISSSESLEHGQYISYPICLATHICRSCVKVLIAICWPRSPSSNSWNFSCFHIVLIFPIFERLPFLAACLATSRSSSSRQLNKTMHPVKDVSNVAAISGRDRRRCSGFCFDRIMAWMCDKEALMTAASEEIATTVVGAS
jgi:hypothetical protein